MFLFVIYFTCFINKESNHCGLYADFLCACLGPQADILPFLVCSVIFRYIFYHMQFIQPCPKRLIYLAYHIYIAPIKILTGNIIGKIEKINFCTLYRIVYQIRKSIDRFGLIKCENVIKNYHLFFIPRMMILRTHSCCKNTHLCN